MMMPLLFVGHGNPMNAIELNEFSRTWRKLARELPIPKCILVVSAHWLTDGTFVSASDTPDQIYDMYGFPQSLYDLKYTPPGSKFYAKKVMQALDIPAQNDWGIDHGSWSVLVHMYPEADVPVLQLSIDLSKSYAEHYALGQKLRALRKEGVLIIGSGNIVHNLRLVDWDHPGGFRWAQDFDESVKQWILKTDHLSLMQHPMSLAVPTTDHFLPLLYVLGASNIIDQIEVFNEACIMGALSMTSYLFYR